MSKINDAGHCVLLLLQWLKLLLFAIIRRDRAAKPRAHPIQRLGLLHHPLGLLLLLAICRGCVFGLSSIFWSCTWQPLQHRRFCSLGTHIRGHAHTATPQLNSPSLGQGRLFDEAAKPAAGPALIASFSSSCSNRARLPLLFPQCNQRNR